MKILAFDCAQKTGWAFMENGKIIESGTQDYRKKRGESNGLLFLKYRKWFLEMIKQFEPEVVAYERAHFRGGPATEIGVGLQTRVQETATELDLILLPIHTGALKKFATGVGNAGKQEMVDAAELIIGREVCDDNEADAIHLARFAHSDVG